MELVAIYKYNHLVLGVCYLELQHFDDATESVYKGCGSVFYVYNG